MFHWKWRKKLIPGVKSRKHLMIYLLDAATRTPSALGLSCQRHQPSHLCSHWGTIWAGHCQVARLVKYGILIVWLFEFFSCREVFGLWGLAGGATDDWYITQVIQNSKRLLSNKHPGKGICKLHGKLLFTTGSPLQLHIWAARVRRSWKTPWIPLAGIEHHQGIWTFWLFWHFSISPRLGDSSWLDLAHWQASCQRPELSN